MVGEDLVLLREINEVFNSFVHTFININYSIARVSIPGRFTTEVSIHKYFKSNGNSSSQFVSMPNHLSNA